MEKRLITALALSLGILLIFQVLGPKKQTRAAISPTQQHVTDKEVTIEKKMDKVREGENLTEITTDKYILVFSDIDAGLKEIALREYTEDDKEQTIYKATGVGSDLFALSGGILAGIEGERYESKRTENTLEYVYEEPGVVAVKKKYTFYNSLNSLQLEIEIKNLTEREKTFSFQIEGPSKLCEAGKVAGREFTETVSLIDGEKWKIKRLKGAQEKSGNVAWVGAKNRYFTLIMKPIEETKAVTVAPDEEKTIRTILKSREYLLLPKESLKAEYLLYAGPLTIETLKDIGYGMEEMVDYGFFGAVSKKLLAILRFLHTKTKSWGISIILLTLLINTILFPLTFKSFASMQKMKKVQPHMQKLKELHKDNPQKLNKETMELYKKYNINPLGGCLPMLLQMPIFIALYQGLMNSIELKGAHFLWIKDLSRPDAVPLPFSLPLVGQSLNILPLLMVGMMVVQQKISQSFTPGTGTAEQAKQQRTMMLMMPIFFGFLFYKMPSGLVLYWLTNTILMTAEQSFISKKVG
ncbi:MAG: membrane protein insertase YidC [Candidatus Omnitrophota bacterium]